MRLQTSTAYASHHLEHHLVLLVHTPERLTTGSVVLASLRAAVQSLQIAQYTFIYKMHWLRDALLRRENLARTCSSMYICDRIGKSHLAVTTALGKSTCVSGTSSTRRSTGRRAFLVQMSAPPSPWKFAANHEHEAL